MLFYSKFLRFHILVLLRYLAQRIYNKRFISKCHITIPRQQFHSISQLKHYRLIVTEVHSPSLLFRIISRSSNVINCFTRDNPNPKPIVPLAASPCQNGSQICCICSWEIPAPVSRIVIPYASACISTVPHVGVNFPALSSILVMMRSKNHWCVCNVALLSMCWTKVIVG